ncbi:vacuolar sorting protein 39 domain 2-domain-containing protein [Mucor mucedo]|uniref:vacuolar sorting protein 39 domain 2-domain-containing protein n=1 Tax=Mucor mucedo TaxID=29922 RepID=UPI002220237E|nr:vacuolar sorting protein 39 domain 2-domain-containing protein [Mucor mucedo]KAI7897305.1 vacuolar sorting protein 39 domain 2-domain-containing protein [Mucor mucedo]
MPYTPYTLQTILSSPRIEEPIQASTSTSFFSRRPTSPSSPSTDGVTSPTIRYSSTNRIDSVAAWDSDVYCGTSDGVILHYSIEDTSSPDKTFSTRLENTINLGFGKRSVERILLIPQVSKAVVLCDSTLSFFSLPFFDPIPVPLIQPIKGVSCFSHDIGEEGRIGEDGTVELSVIKRRAIQIYKIGESMHLKKEIPLPDGALTLTRHSKIICLADSQIYKLINLQQSFVTELIPTPQVSVTPTLLLGSGTQPRPLVAVVKQDEFLLVSGNEEGQIGLFINGNGDPIRGTLQWSSYPKALCVEFPYVAALLRNNSIEIHNILDQTLLQTIPLDPSIDAKGMALGHGIKVWMDELAHKLQRHPWQKEEQEDVELSSQLQREISRYSTAAARILVYGNDTVLAQVSTPLVVQVDSLLENNLVEEAMQLAEQARNTMSSDNNVYVERLRSELDYTYQKSGLLLLKETLFDDAFTLLSKGDLDPRVVIHLFEGLAQSKWLKEAPTILLFDGVRALIEEVGSVKDVVNHSLNSEDNQPEMRRVLLLNAREALKKYLLLERRKRRDRMGQNDTLCKVIDTSLLKIYMSQKDDKSIYELLKQPNDCSIEDCAKALSKSKKYYALSIMYESKHMYEKVLDIWTKIYSGELPDEEFKDGLTRIKRLLLKDVHSQELPLSVIMRYAWWLTHESPADGVEVFTRSPRTEDMDPDEILDKLESYSNEGVRTYLEYLVMTQKSERAEYHTRLACSYVRDVQKEIENNNQSKQMDELVKGFKKHVNPMKIENPDTSDTLSKSTFVGYLASQKTPLVKLRLLLIRLLLRSQLYSPEVLLTVLSKAGPLAIEKAIVFGRMGKHKEALDILIHELSDFVGAETYCVTNGQSTGVIPAAASDDDNDQQQQQQQQHQTMPRSSSLVGVKERPLPTLIPEKDGDYLSTDQLNERKALFTMLFKSYIAIKDSKLMIARSMHLLNTQGVYLDTLEVLETIPEDWSVHMLQDFLIRSLRRSLDDYNESRIVVALGRGENLMVSSEMIKTYKEIGSITVDYETTCLKCHRIIGDSIFVRESEHGQILHLHCAKLLRLVE